MVDHQQFFSPSQTPTDKHPLEHLIYAAKRHPRELSEHLESTCFDAAHEQWPDLYAEEIELDFEVDANPPMQVRVTATFRPPAWTGDVVVETVTIHQHDENQWALDTQSDNPLVSAINDIMQLCQSAYRDDSDPFALILDAHHDSTAIAGPAGR